MQLKANTYYRTRDGRKAFVAAIGNPFNADESCSAVGWIDGDDGEFRTWRSDGRWYEGENPDDLVAEWYEPAEQPASEERAVFWLVWSPEGFPPRYRHKTRPKALDESRRLAIENPGKQFYVLCCEAVSERQPGCETKALHAGDELRRDVENAGREIPF